MKKLFSILMASLLLVSTAAGCGSKTSSDSETTLNIYGLEAGYGTAWLAEYEKIFEAENPGIDVAYKTSTEAYTKMYEDMRLGPNKNKYDLYFAPDMGYQFYIEDIKVPGYDVVFEDLSDLYDTKIPGEDVTIREKLYTGIDEFNVNYNGKQYGVPWGGGATGFVYNADILSDAEVPRTTDQLMKVLDKMYTYNGKDVYSLMVSENGHGYWEYIGDTWHAQLEGVDSYKNFYNLGDGSSITHEVYYQDGYRRNFELIEEVIKTAKLYPNCNAMPHTQAQMYFLEGKALMMPMGNWLEGEMNQNFEGETVNFKMMKVPVISDIADPDKLNLPGATEEERDQVLVSIIDYIDAGKTGEKPAGVSDMQIKIIENARSVCYNAGSGCLMMIPAYSNAKDLAKKFIQLVASDRGIEIYYEKSKTTTAFKYDYESFGGSTLFKSYLKIYNEGAYMINSNAYGTPERVKEMFKKFNTNINAYRDLQFGQTTAKALVDAEIAYAEKTIPTWNY